MLSLTSSLHTTNLATGLGIHSYIYLSSNILFLPAYFSNRKNICRSEVRHVVADSVAMCNKSSDRLRMPLLYLPSLQYFVLAYLLKRQKKARSSDLRHVIVDSVATCNISIVVKQKLYGDRRATLLVSLSHVSLSSPSVPIVHPSSLSAPTFV
ncbi:hypothetical protein RJT34_19957 [Clitoria ternatea]|uniref:Uncharacterized protein n=1 Tax=Clitoria ternatea TaxID=43366 RepID=A0AAN9ISB1_CLITE